MTLDYPCPCCGYLVNNEPPGSYYICPICFWEDDQVQLAFPDMRGGANEPSLIEAQRNFAAYGAESDRSRQHVCSPGPNDRREAGWRPLDPARDRYLHDNREEDHLLWRSVMMNKNLCLYYWRSDYWLLAHPA